MLRKALFVFAAIATIAVAIPAYLYLTNRTPVVAAIADVQAAAGRPYIIKLHAQWCPVCMVTKGAWSGIEEAYADRTNLMVWDFTDEATTARSYEDAKRLGLTGAFDEYRGVTGLIIVVDGSGKVTGDVGGVESFATYSAVLDQILAGRRVGE